MKALVDADILRYEIAYAAETGWKAITEREETPPFDYVSSLLEQRIASILSATSSDDLCLFLTEGKTFRYEIAKTRPYKGTRKDKKPWHFKNLSAYIPSAFPCKIIKDIEADDAMAIEHSSSDGNTIICSRDKDLRQVPGMLYSWELGKQPSFGPKSIDKLGSVLLVNNKKLMGEGFAFFCAQLLIGDPVDNIPGCHSVGPVGANRLISNILQDDTIINKYDALINMIVEQYKKEYNDMWEKELLEQGQLCWIVRRLNKDGTPVIWEIGMYE